VSGPDVVDLGGCEGCGLGCAIACASGQRDTARHARQVLAATGVALAVLAGVPAVVTAHAWITVLGTVAALAGAVTTVLAVAALRAGRPGGDAAARLAYRVMPLGVAGMAATWLAVAVGLVTD
jgi:hypothetical protein